MWCRCKTQHRYHIAHLPYHIFITFLLPPLWRRSGRRSTTNVASKKGVRDVPHGHDYACFCQAVKRAESMPRRKRLHKMGLPHSALPVCTNARPCPRHTKPLVKNVFRFFFKAWHGRPLSFHPQAATLRVVCSVVKTNSKNIAPCRARV